MQVKLAEADSIDIKLALYKLQASVVSKDGTTMRDCFLKYIKKNPNCCFFCHLFVIKLKIRKTDDTFYSYSFSESERHARGRRKGPLAIADPKYGAETY